MRSNTRTILDSGVAGRVYLPQTLKDCMQGAEIDFECGGMQFSRVPAMVCSLAAPLISLDLLALKTGCKRVTVDFFQRRIFLEKR